jgi:hypothetical protein
MRWPTARLVLQGLLVAFVVLVTAGRLMKAVGLNVRFGQPPEFGWTLYPMVAVAHWAEPGGSLSPTKLPPRQSRELLGIDTLQVVGGRGH